MSTRPSAVPYVAPFAVFIALIVLHGIWPLPERADQALRIAIVAAVLWFASRRVIDLRVRRWAGSVFMGALIFVVWVGPDLLFPGYRHSFLFENPLLGAGSSSLSSDALQDPVVLALRTLRAVVIVPLVEELFWRGWLMRWIINPKFNEVSLGAYTPSSFWFVAVLFASEHGTYWDVGLVAGVIFNAWMVRTKSLGDLILVHAVANACLSAYVIAAGKWEYWL